MTKPILLLIDDELDILDYLTKTLEADYSILNAVNGRDGLSVIKQEHVDLVVSDVMMPDMDGFELCKTIKNDFDYSHIPVILLTAKNTMQAKIDGLELGADAYIEKPFSPQYLKVQIANLLKNRNKLREYFATSPLSNLKSIAHTKADEKFLDRLHEAIHASIEDTELDIDNIAVALNMSRSTFYRKIKGISDLSPNEMINVIRLKKAALLIQSGKFTIGEIYERVGYSSHKYFSSLFQKQFGLTPYEYEQFQNNNS